MKTTVMYKKLPWYNTLLIYWHLLKGMLLLVLGTIGIMYGLVYLTEQKEVYIVEGQVLTTDQYLCSDGLLYLRTQGLPERTQRRCTIRVMS